MAYFVGVLHGRVHHAWRHYAGVVGLYLEVDVIGVGIVLPMSGFGRHYALEYVVASLEIGVPKRITGVGKSIGEAFHGGVQPFALEDLDEGEIHIHVVVEPGHVVVPPLHDMIVPFYGILIGDETGELELGGAAVGAANHLSGPGTAYLVLEGLLADGKFLSFKTCSRQDGQSRGCDKKKSDFHTLVNLCG